MGSLVVIPHFAGGLFFWPLYRVFARNPNPVLNRQLALIFLAALLALAGLTGVLLWAGNEAWWKTGLFPVINFVVILLSSVACMRSDASSQERFSKPHVAATAGAAFVFAAVMLVGGGFRNLDIMLHEARTTATVTGIGSHGVILYKYQVDGHIYGSGGDPGNPPYPRGSTFEIRYSTAHPYFSSAENPSIIFGQMLVGMAFVGAGAYSICYSNARKKAKAT
jgi:hypothetical protein